MHFFTEPTKLDNQANTDPFGPLDGDETNKYRISSKHKVTADAKLFACQDSMMLVLPHIVASTSTVSTALVNLVLKPIKGLDIPLSPVKYYIYRGVDINSFISSGSITPDDPATKTEFITKFWKNWNDYTTNLGIPPTPAPTPKSFGYDPSLSTSPRKTELLEEYFNSAESTNTVINDFQAIKVTEGEWIGNILSGINFEFEIVVDTDHVTMNLEYAEMSEQIIDASGLTINASNPSLNAIAAREKVLNYIDPAAFFGMHQEVGVYLGAWTGSTKDPSVLKQGAFVISDVLVKFLNKEVVYLDLRSERGYSYYYYQNYREDLFSGTVLQWSETIKLKTSSQATFNYLDYASLHWPLVNLNNPSFNLDPIVQGDKIELKLLVKDNEEPLLFVENPKLLGAKNKNNFVDSVDLVDPSGPIPDYSLVITLTIPSFLDGTVNKNFPNHIKLQYFRKKDSSSSPDTVFKTTYYLNAAFGGIKIPELVVKTPFQHIENTKRSYVTDGVDFGYVSKNGVLQDGNQVLFYVENDFSFKTSSNTYPVFDPTLVPSTDVDAILKLKNVILNKWKINDGLADIDVLGIIGYNRTSLEVTPKENLFLLGLTKTELSDLNSLSGLSDLHHKYVVLTELFDVGGTPFIDTISSLPYRKFRIDIQGIDSTTFEVVTIDSSSLTTNVIVYGMTDYVLCSKDFGANSIVPIQLPDPGTYIDFDGYHKVSYTSSSPMVTDLFPNGRVRIRDNKMTFDGSNIPDHQDIDIQLFGDIYLPVDKKGGTILSAKKANFPIIAICHANGAEYTNYEFLAGYLAQNGFIVCTMSAKVDERRKFNVFKMSDLPSTPIPSTSPTSYEEFQYYFELSGFPAVDTTKFYVIVDNRYFNPQSGGVLWMYVYGNDPADTSSYGKLFNVNYTFTPKHPYNSSFGTDPSVFNYLAIGDTGWKNGTEFQIYINPESVTWQRKGSKPGTGLGKFGLKWLKNIGSSSFSARIAKAGTKLVELTVTEWNFDKQSEIKNAIDSGTGLSHVDISFPSTTIDRYLGTIVDEIYYLIKINSSTVTSSSSGSIVTISTEVKNRQLELIHDRRQHGARILSRANLVFPHLQICKKYIEETFNLIPGNNRIQNNLGIIGHSRGAEAVVRCVHETAAGVNSFDWLDFVDNGNDNRTDPTWDYLPDGLNNINAVISLAPTDASKDQAESIIEDVPYLVIYGSLEGDVVGSPTGTVPNRTSGFSIYDRSSNNTQKGMAFVYGATHRGFIIDNDDFDVTFTGRYGNGGLTAEPVATQQNVAKAYMNSFMRQHLKNEMVWAPYSYGDLIPASIGYNKIYLQYKDMQTSPSKWINDFTGSMGTVSYGGTFFHDQLINLDTRTPHDTEGILLTWVASTASDLLIGVDSGGKDISSYDYLSFRIGKAMNALGYADLSKLIIELKYIGMPSSGNFTKTINQTIPDPYQRTHTGYGDKLTKTAMMTVRIPLDEFQSNGVDLTKITGIQITFPSTLTKGGNVIIDDVEFTN